MRKIIIPIMLMLLMVSFASAGLTTLSGSQIAFSTSDGDFQNAYLISVVENGGSDKIYFANFPEPSGGYTKEANSGYIDGDLTEFSISYPYTQRSNAKVYDVMKLNGGASKYFLSWSAAQDWCNTLTSSAYFVAAKDWGGLGIGNYYCYVTNEIGTIGDIQTPKYNWKEKFTIYNRVSGESSETTTLVIDGATGQTSESYEFTPNKKARIKYAFSGGTLDSAVPQIQSNYDVFYTGGGVRIVEEIKNTENIHNSQYNTILKFGECWLGSDFYKVYVLKDRTWTSTVQNPTYYCDNKVNSYNAGLATATTIRVNDWSTANIDQQAGAITMQNTAGKFPIANVFTIKLDAEWIGIDEPKGKPVIDYFVVKGEKYIEGDYNAGFSARVRNDGDASSFQYVLTCSPSIVRVDARNQESYSAGQTRTFDVRAYANTAGQNINAECCLEVKDYNDPSITSGKVCDDILFLESNTCPSGMDAGHSTCGANNEILQCLKNNDGVLVLQSTSQFCPYGCSVLGTIAQCAPAPTCADKYTGANYCGDKICETFERSGKECECLNDCSTCGDQYCSPLENEADNCPQDCGADPYCGDKICGINEFGLQETNVKGTAGYCKADCDNGGGNGGGNTALIIFGVLGGGGLAAAIGLRLKKEGYFGK